MTIGSASVLECLASGSPKPHLRWSKDGAAILITERHFFAAEEQLLIIVGTQLTDAGAYECEMKNELGASKGGARLTVLVPSGRGIATASVNDIVGIVVITIVLCAVMTSIVWVAIIYKAKRATPPDVPATVEEPPPPDEELEDSPKLVVNIHVNQLHRMLDEPDSSPLNSSSTFQ